VKIETIVGEIEITKNVANDGVDGNRPRVREAALEPLGGLCELLQEESVEHW